MRKIFILSILLSFAYNSDAQLIRWMKSYGDSGYDYGRDIKEDNDSGYVVTGSSSSFVSDNADVYLLKVD